MVYLNLLKPQEVTDIQFLVYYRRLVQSISLAGSNELPKFTPSLELLRRQATNTFRTACVIEVEYLINHITRSKND